MGAPSPSHVYRSAPALEAMLFAHEWRGAELQKARVEAQDAAMATGGGAGEAVVRPSAEGAATGVRTSGMCSAGFALRPVVVRRGLIEGLPLESGGEGVFSRDKSEPSLA